MTEDRFGSEAVTPDLDKLRGTEPPCIQALVRQGGLLNKTFEAAAAALASYCIAANVKASRIQLLSVRLADGFVGHSLRDEGQRQRHITSLCQQQPESVYKFTCERMRAHRADESGLRFDCVVCVACKD